MSIKKNSGFNRNRTFGIEIEGLSPLNRNDLAQSLESFGIKCVYEGYNHRLRRHWKIVTDSSICEDQGTVGFELVSPPLRGVEGLEEIRKVCNALQQIGCRVNRSCGLHVHHDASDYNVEAFKNLYAIYIRYEAAIDELVSESRRGERNRYCNSLGGEFGLARIRSVRQMDQLLSEAYPSRYMKLNCQSYEIHGTVEFRQHQGTIDGEKIVAWVVFTQMMVERAVAGKIRMKKGAADWFNLKKVIRGYKWMGADEIQQEAIAFLNKRRQALLSNAAA